jgi:hypothetical protein
MTQVLGRGSTRVRIVPEGLLIFFQTIGCNVEPTRAGVLQNVRAVSRHVVSSNVFYVLHSAIRVESISFLVSVQTLGLAHVGVLQIDGRLDVVLERVVLFVVALVAKGVDVFWSLDLSVGQPQPTGVTLPRPPAKLVRIEDLIEDAWSSWHTTLIASSERLTLRRVDHGRIGISGGGLIWNLRTRT